MEKKRSQKKRYRIDTSKFHSIPLELYREVTTPADKYDIYVTRLTKKGTVGIFKDDVLEEKCVDIGLKSLQGGREGGRATKRKVPIDLYVVERISKAPGRTVRGLWNDIPLQSGAVNVGGFDLYRRDDELVVDGDGKEKTIRFDAFKKIVARLKKGGK
jgi:hypothetical protein